MKTTANIRIVDELGRIFIPKEVRRTLQIKENDFLEFSINRTTGSIILKKYDMHEKIAEEIEGIVSSYYACLTDDIITTLTDVADKLRG